MRTASREEAVENAEGGHASDSLRAKHGKHQEACDGGHRDDNWGTMQPIQVSDVWWAE
jgi:hypothetical protein